MIMPRLGLASVTKIARVVREIPDPAATGSCQVSVVLGLCSFASHPHVHQMANAEHASHRSTQREHLTTIKTCTHADCSISRAANHHRSTARSDRGERCPTGHAVSAPGEHCRSSAARQTGEAMLEFPPQ